MTREELRAYVYIRKCQRHRRVRRQRVLLALDFISAAIVIAGAILL